MIDFMYVQIEIVQGDLRYETIRRENDRFESDL
jgi:hypothetical protein